MTEALETHRRLMDALGDPDCYPHPADSVERMETHISTVLLAGEHVYKFKKPLDLGFLDFTSGERRRFYCEEELRLNRRFAPSLYLGLSTVNGEPERPRVDGDGVVLEYAVRMRRFPQEQRLDHVLARGSFTGIHADTLADDLAAFHLKQAAARPPENLARVEAQLQPVTDNLTQLEAAGIRLPEGLRAWTESRITTLAPLMSERLEAGLVRECHGDLHLENIVLLDDRPTLFDGIEFDPALRWIDVMNELAFLLMDLEHRQQPGLAARILSRYLDASGDHAGVPLLRFFQVYRALVRTKVRALRLAEGGMSDETRDRAIAARDRYLDQVRAYMHPPEPFLAVTCGLSGSGKSTAALALVERGHAIRLRSDVERKRLHGLSAMARTNAPVAGDMYGSEASRQTYERLETLARELVSAGWPVVVDAACLHRDERSRFRRLAAELGCSWHLLYCQEDETTLRERIRRRAAGGRDPSEADERVLEYQLDRFEPPDADELDHLLTADPPAPGQR